MVLSAHGESRRGIPSSKYDRSLTNDGTLKVSFNLFLIFCLRACYELEKKSSLVSHAFSTKSCIRDTDSLHSCTWRKNGLSVSLVQDLAEKAPGPNLIPILNSIKSPFKIYEHEYVVAVVTTRRQHQERATAA